MTLKTNKNNRKNARARAKAGGKVLLPKTVKNAICLGAPRGDGHFQNGDVTICHLVYIWIINLQWNFRIHDLGRGII